MNLTQVTAPAQLPLELPIVREHLRVIDAGEDDLITGYIQAAAEHVGGRYGILGRSLITQTWDLKLARWPSLGLEGLKLPLPPVKSVEHVKYLDQDSIEQTLDPSLYSFNPGEYAPKLRAASGVSWPADLASDSYPITVRFECGFGDNSDDIPMPIRQALLLIIGHWYENRSEVEACELTQIPMASTTLLSPYMVTELVL